MASILFNLFYILQKKEIKVVIKDTGEEERKEEWGKFTEIWINIDIYHLT